MTSMQSAYRGFMLHVGEWSVCDICRQRVTCYSTIYVVEVLCACRCRQVSLFNIMSSLLWRVLVLGGAFI